MAYQTKSAASFGEILRAVSEAQYQDYTVNGECSNCGECCSNLLPMSRREVDAIRRYVKRRGIREQKHFVPTARPMYDMICPFRDNANRRCTIYEARPHICRVWSCRKAVNGEEMDLMPIAGARLAYVRETFFGEDS